MHDRAWQQCCASQAAVLLRLAAAAAVTAAAAAGVHLTIRTGVTREGRTRGVGVHGYGCGSGVTGWEWASCIGVCFPLGCAPS
jgi:hypothetical protein